jgi:hypothetical protein
MVTKKNNKPRKTKTKTINKNIKSKKNNKTRTNNKTTNMKGGANQIGGFIGMMKFLNDFDDSIHTDSSAPKVIEYIDLHGMEQSIMYRWVRGLTNNKTNNEESFIDNNDQVRTFYDFDDFSKVVIDSLGNIEIKIQEANILYNPEIAEFRGLSMLSKTNTGNYPYYILAKNGTANEPII